MTKHLPALIIGSDASMFDPAGDAAKRMERYTELYGEVHVLIVARGIPGEVREVRPNVFVHPVPYQNKALGLAALWREGERLMNGHAFCALYAQDPFFMGLVGLRLARRFRIPIAVGVYGTDIRNRAFTNETLFRRIGALIAPIVYKQADAIQTDGPETVAPLERRYGKKVFFKPMFPANRGELSSLERRVPPSPFSLLFVGRFAHQKNLPLLADVIALASQRLGDGVRFTLVGGGALKKDLMEGLAKRGALGSVVDAGVLDRAAILDAYATHHMLILTSHYEGFPRVFMEAALAGMPIITTDVGGVMNLVEDSVTGRVFPQGTPAEPIAEAIAELAASPENVASMSRAIKERFEKVYGGKDILDYQCPLADFLEYIRTEQP